MLRDDNVHEFQGQTRLYCWGSLVQDENIPQKKTLKKALSKKTQPLEIAFDKGTSPIVSMSAGKDHLAIISNDQKLYLLGSNSSGQVLPNSKNKDSDILVPRLLSKSGSYKVVQVSCGFHHTAYLTNLGRVYSFGGNSFGQLGHSEDRRQNFVAPRLMQGAAHEIMTMVSCGSLSTYVLTKQGKVYATGCGGNGRLGLANRKDFKRNQVFLSDMINSESTVNIIQECTKNVFSLKEVKGLLAGVPISKIAAGNEHCIALTITGKVFGWGSNVAGQLGLKIRNKSSSSLTKLEDGVPQPTCISELDNVVVSVAAGADNSALVYNNGISSSIFGAYITQDAKGQLNCNWEEVYLKDIRILKVCCGSGLALLLMSDGNVLALGKVNKLALNKKPKKIEERGVCYYLIEGLRAFEVEMGASNMYVLQSPDFKALGKYFHTEKHISLNKKMFSMFRTENSNLLQEDSQVFMYFRKLFSDMRSLNASFLITKQADIKALQNIINKESEEAFLETSFLNIPYMLSFSEKIVQAKFSELEKLKVRQIAASLVAQLEFSSKGVHEPDQLRAYFILLVSPILPNLCPNEYEALIVSIFNLPLVSRRRIFSWIYVDLVCRDIALFLDLLVRPVLKVVDTHVRRRKFTRQGVYLCKLLHCLHEICIYVNVESETRDAKISFSSKGLIPSPTFYTTAFDDYTEASLQEMYKKWHAVVTEGGESLTGSNMQTPFFGLFGSLVDNNDNNRNPTSVETKDFSLKSNLVPEKNTFGLQKFGPEFLKIVDNSIEDTLGEISPDLVFFKHPFLLSANTKRRFMKIDDHYMHTRYVLQFFSQAINPHLILEIKRGKHMISETFEKLRQFQGNNEILLRRPLRIKFTGEEGLDAGGVKKEFFLLLSQDLFSPDFGYFTTLGSNSLIWFNNKIDQTMFKEQKKFFTYKEYLEYVEAFSNRAEQLQNMEIIGTLMGLAVYNDTLIDVQFPPTLYELLLNNFNPDKLDINSYRQFDPKGAEQLEYLISLENEEDLEDLDMTFVLSQENYGVVTEVEICRDGQGRKVTKGNLKEYIKEYVKFKMYSPLVELQAKALRKGFTKLISAKHAALNLFNADELEMLLCGTPELDFKVLEKNCVYEGGFNEKHKAVVWFWKILNEFDYEHRKKFLKFTTGSSRAPIGGLKNVKFKVQRAGPDSPQLPTSHTCFNTLMLPEYSTAEKMKRLLLLAVENSEGFGLQ